MLISNIINDSLGLLSKQLRFYCWHFRRNLDQRQRQELIELLQEQHFERLANKIRSLNQGSVADCKQQVGKLLLDHCFTRNKRHLLIQLIESKLVDINVRLDNYGRTLLHRSAYNLDVDLVRIMINNGVNIRLRDYAGNTALHIAIQSYRNGSVLYGETPDVVKNLTSIVKLLLQADRELQSDRCRRKRIKLSPNTVDTLSRSKAKKYGQHLDSVNFDDSISQVAIDRSLYLQPQNDDSDPSLQRSNLAKKHCTTVSEQLDSNQKSPAKSITVHKEQREFTKRPSTESKESDQDLNPILLEDLTSPLIDTKNAFGRTALHYCVSVVGEQHLEHFVKLLISFGADIDATDGRMRTPLYCLVKRTGIAAIKQKCLAMTQLLDNGCDDLGLAIDAHSYFNDKLINSLEQDLSSALHSRPDSYEAVFMNFPFKRVPTLKHICRLHLVKLHDEEIKLKRQSKLTLPDVVPTSLNLYINRKILDQSELF